MKADDDDGNAAAQAEPERKPNTARQVAVDAFEELPAATQQKMRDLAIQVIDLYDNKEPMTEFVKAHKLDQEGKLALWSQLPSHVRSGFKKEEKQFTATELGSQP